MLPARHVDVAVVGAGQVGLATSHCLSRLGIDHLLLEQRDIAASWEHQRWDSLRLLTPNWMTRLPGADPFPGPPDGFARATEVAAHLRRYARRIEAPVLAGCVVERIDPHPAGWRLKTSAGVVHARAVVLATGPGSTPRLPPVAGALDPSLRSLHALDYTNPDDVEDGGVLVVGASASGAQIADELARAGRDVVLAVGEHVRAVRSYRGRDLYWWLDRTGILDEPYDEVDDLARVRATPSFQLVGSDDGREVDLTALQSRGVRVAGRLVAGDEQRVQFSGSLAGVCTAADLKLERLLARFDDHAAAHAGDEALDGLGEPTRPPRTVLRSACLDLPTRCVRTVVWATGLAPSFPRLGAPVFDHRGRLVHDGGVLRVPGLFVLGLPFLRRRRSSFIDGAGGDAEVIARRIRAGFEQRRQVA